ncbi:MAG: MaoC family dehydratase N-terminal domain-containing protein [Actinobacteria bacterium]|nr:MaoC family dehydratase N-terminal domain-containing protein [Actinomycetota bacterium]
MPLDPTLKGREYGEVSLEVEVAHVVRFAEAIGDANLIYRDAEAGRAAGHPGQLAPPTFATVLQIMTSARVIADQDLGLNYALVVHGEQEYEWSRPIRVGDRLSAVPRIADIRARGPNEYLVLEADVRDDAGQRVVLARTTLLSRGTAVP